MAKAANSNVFLLQIVQPGLAGLMDGSVSTLAPIFATAFATHQPHTTFLVGSAAAVGAGISMAFSEGLSDDGSLTGRGNPFVRGAVIGFMTFLGGTIAYRRYRYFASSFLISAIEVIVGGALVFTAAVLIGSS